MTPTTLFYGALLLTIGMQIASIFVLYFFTLFQWNRRTTEEAVRYIRDHGPKDSKNDDLVTYANNRIEKYERVGGARRLRRSRVTWSIIFCAFALYVIVKWSIHSYSEPFAPILLLIVVVMGFGIITMFHRIVTTQIGIFREYLEG